MMRWKRIIGTGTFGLLLFLSVLGPLLSPYDVDERSPMRSETTSDGRTVPLPPPFPPDAQHLLGTDQVGYDLLTRLLHGARFTFGFVVGGALLRIILATALATMGYLLSSKRRRYHMLTDRTVRVGSAIPEFVIVYVVFRNIVFNPVMSPMAMASMQAAVVAIVGLPNLVPVIRSRIDHLHAQAFVEAQMSIGAGPLHIYAFTILPGLARQALLLITQEALIVALIVGELAVFNIFIGGTIRTNDPVEYYSRSHEWAGMIGENRLEIFSDRLWLILIPLSAYLLLIFSLGFLGSSLRRQKNRNL